MKLSDAGEDRLVRRIARRVPLGTGVVQGIGDDCAVVEGPGRGWLGLLKTDCVVEGVHFTSETAWSKVGWKAMARVVSDFAAMGGEPQHALVTVCASPGRAVADLDGLYSGIGRAARAFGVGVVGGELSRSLGGLLVSISMSGRVRARQWVGRDGGRAGDLLYVTGRLGGSFRTGNHLHFKPRLSEGQWLAGKRGIRAMMDLSDGLASDLPRLAEASRCGFRIGEVPCTPGSTQGEALHDGEDYELLIAVDPIFAPGLERAWRRAFPRLPLSHVGELTAKRRRVGDGVGFDHFREEQ